MNAVCEVMFMLSDVLENKFKISTWLLENVKLTFYWTFCE